MVGFICILYQNLKSIQIFVPAVGIFANVYLLLAGSLSIKIEPKEHLSQSFTNPTPKLPEILSQGTKVLLVDFCIGDLML